MACQTGGTVSYPKMEVPGRKVFDPRRTCVMRVTVVVLCVCVSAFSILPSRAFRHPTRGISCYCTGNTVKSVIPKTV